MNPLLGMVFAMAVSLAVIPIVWRYAPRLGLLDLPSERKIHKKAVPRVGGWGIAIGALLPVAILLPLDPLIQSYLLGSLILFIFGVGDDIRELNHYVKFLGQFLAVALVVFYGGLWIERMPFTEVSSAFGIPFTFFAIVGMTNAVNTSDGLDGLAGGEALLSLIVIAFLAYVAEGNTSIVIAAASVGGILGFLRYNTYPARVFMGDGGSQFLGFTLGFLAVLLTQKDHPTLSPAVTLLFLGLPIIDILSAIVTRISQGKKWYVADKSSHIHHRLLRLGFAQYGSVIIIYGLHALLVAAAVLMRYEYDILVVAFYLFVWMVMIVLLALAEKTGWREDHLSPQDGYMAEAMGLASRFPAIKTLPTTLVATLIPVYLGGIGLLAGPASKDMGVISAVLFAVMVAELLFGRGAASIAVRGGIYIAAVFAVYLTIHTPVDVFPPFWVALETAYFIVLAVAIALNVRYATDKRFEATPLDYLLMLGVLTIGFFGQRYLQVQEIGGLVVRTMILLYGCEVLIERSVRRWNLLSVSSTLALGIFGVKGLFAF